MIGLLLVAMNLSQTEARVLPQATGYVISGL